MRIKNTILIITALLLVFVAAFVFLFQNEESELFHVSVFGASGEETVVPYRSENGAYFVFLPSYADLSQCRLRLLTSQSLRLNDLSLTDGMGLDCFSLDTAYSLSYSFRGKLQEYELTFLRTQSISTLCIDTQSGGMGYIHAQKGNEEKGQLRLYSAEGALLCDGELASINGRGNNTWEAYDKKSYSLTLSEEADLMSMGSAQKWILLANAGDPTHLRNKVAFDLASAMESPFVPSCHWVEVYFNGDYAGLYLLCERNEVHSERVDISFDTGFLISCEPERRLKEQGLPYVLTDLGYAFRVHYPEAPTDEDLMRIDQAVQTVENALHHEGGRDPLTGKAWQDLIDVDSWAKKYLLLEICGDPDAGLASEFFYYEDGKLFAGPVWDYDHAMANDFDGWCVTAPNALAVDWKKNNLFSALLCNEEFIERVTAVYEETFRHFDAEAFLSEYPAVLSRAAEHDAVRWSVPEETEYDLQVGKIERYLAEHLSYLKQVLDENEQYCFVSAQDEYGVSLCYAVRSGETLVLPTLQDDEQARFVGWYYTDTDLPYDASDPITEDLSVYARYEADNTSVLKKVVKMAPLAVFGIVFVALAVVEWRRIHKRQEKIGDHD